MNQKVCRHYYGRWLVYYSLSLAPPLFRLVLFGLLRIKAHLNICLLGLALDGEITLESIENGLALFCYKYKSSDVSVYFTVMNMALELISSYVEIRVSAISNGRGIHVRLT